MGQPQPKQAKAKEDEKLPLFKTNLVTFFLEGDCKTVASSHEESVRDTRDNWGAVDYGISQAVYEDDPAGVKKMMKEYGYYPLGEKPRSGCYFFQHYTNKKKPS